MKRKTMYFGIFKTVAIALVVAIGAVGIVLNALYLAGVLGFDNNRTLSVVSLVCSALVGLFALEILTVSNYTFKDDELVALLGIFVDHIKYSAVRSVRENSKTHELTLTYEVTEPHTQKRIAVAHLYLPQRCNEAFEDEIKKRCKNAVVEVFTPEDDKKKKK